MVNQRIENLVDILGEKYFDIENSFVLRNNQELLKGAKSDGWRLVKESGKESYKKILVKMANDIIGTTQQQIEKIYLLSYKTIDSSKVVVTKTEIYGKDLPKSFKNKIVKEKKAAAKDIQKLANSAYASYLYTVKLINPSMKADIIYETIRKQMKSGIENGLKVKYKIRKGKYAGKTRNVSFKAYMEMNSRTTISQEIGKQQISAGAKAGLVFYMCDSFADCAKDHQDYQGKIYYNNRVKLSDEAKAYIRKNNIMSMQEVMEAPVYLTTRPNCRHGFHLISEKRVLGNDISGYKKSFTHGKFDTNNYKLTQEQRKNERLIRKYRLLKEDAQAAYDISKDIKDKEDVLYYGRLQNKWTTANTLLIKNNKKLLKRDKYRENARIVVDDLGVRQDQGIII